MESYRTAVRVLPKVLRGFALGIDSALMARVEEIRMRVGQIPTLVLPEGEQPIPGAAAVVREELEQLVELASRWSLHTVLEQMQRGYLSVEGGHRLGLCGTAVMEGKQLRTLRDISAADLRVARQFPGVATQVANYIVRSGEVDNTLILAPPGAGKTTLLRDLIRNLSSGESGPALRVAVADERGEVAAVWKGTAQMELGSRTDVMDGCPKSVAIPMLLRGMNPQVIAVDEITAREDIWAMEQAVGCGVTLVATAHGSGPEDLKRRPIYREMMDKKIFRNLVTIRNIQGKREIQLSVMGEHL